MECLYVDWELGQHDEYHTPDEAVVVVVVDSDYATDANDDDTGVLAVLPVQLDVGISTARICGAHPGEDNQRTSFVQLGEHRNDDWHGTCDEAAVIAAVVVNDVAFVADADDVLSNTLGVTVVPGIKYKGLWTSKL